MSDIDHYRTLGVLPTAEPVVIVAAYRALAQRYHPDRWSGDPAEAHRRMSAINEAYRVLSDPQLRSAYDAARDRSAHADYQSEEHDEYDHAFTDALYQLEQRWSMAVEIFPDLAARRSGLAKTSTSLAFAFVTLLLESKLFNKRQEIASTLERTFLERYFGTDPIVLDYAKELISAGHRDAARVLNEFVDTLGSDVDPALLIQRIEKQFALRTDLIRRKQAGALVRQVLALGYFDDAVQLAKDLGHSVQENGGGLFTTKFEIVVRSPHGTLRRFQAATDFVKWVQSNLCLG